MSDKLPLNETERILIDGINARHREVVDKYIKPIDHDTTFVLNLIEERLGLPSNSIGQSHEIVDYQVVPVFTEESTDS